MTICVMLYVDLHVIQKINIEINKENEMEIRKEKDDWLIDDYNNRCSISAFGSEEEAENALYSLTDCYDCTNCY